VLQLKRKDQGKLA